MAAAPTPNPMNDQLARGIIDGLIGGDGERLAEHHALGAVTTAPLPPSFAP